MKCPWSIQWDCVIIIVWHQKALLSNRNSIKQSSYKSILCYNPFHMLGFHPWQKSLLYRAIKTKWHLSNRTYPEVNWGKIETRHSLHGSSVFGKTRGVKNKSYRIKFFVTLQRKLLNSYLIKIDEKFTDKQQDIVMRLTCISKLLYWLNYVFFFQIKNWKHIGHI